MKAVVLIVPDDHAQLVASLMAATLTMNGFHHDGPAVIEWPDPGGTTLHSDLDLQALREARP